MNRALICFPWNWIILEQHEGQINLLVEYEVRASNSRFNLVYPFYPMFGPTV